MSVQLGDKVSWQGELGTVVRVGRKRIEVQFGDSSVESVPRSSIDTPTYPTWVKVEPGHYESEEQLDGTPDFIALKHSVEAGWWLKWRSSARWTSGFRTIAEVKEHVAGLVKEGL